MPGIDISPATMTGIKEVMTSTSEKILRLSQGNRLGDMTTVRELYGVLKTATAHVANFLNEGTPAHQLPQEILTRILYLAVDHGSEEHIKQIVSLTHVCRYWRALLLSYPRMWSTLCMKPGNPSLISEWLARSQKVPLTVIAEFSDAYEHPPYTCRYEDSATATLADSYDLEVCPRHEAVLSLDQLLPHRFRIHDLDVLVRSSDPEWDEGDHSGKPPLLYHHFFKESLPNLQRLDFRATHIEQSRYVIPIPELLFAGRLPRLKELKYLGVNGGLTETVKNLVSCEIGAWSKSAGPAVVTHEELQTFFDNNTTLRSLIITDCDFFYDNNTWTPAAALMTHLKYLKIHRWDRGFEKMVNFLHVPQFKSLDTIQVSLSDFTIQTVATDGSGHTFVFSRPINSREDFHPLRYLEADITTLRLDRETTLNQLYKGPVLHKFFETLDTVQVLEFDGAIAVKNDPFNVLPILGIFPGLKVIRVAVHLDDCKGALQLLATTLKLRMEEGNPLTTVFSRGRGRVGSGASRGVGETLRSSAHTKFLVQIIRP